MRVSPPAPRAQLRPPDLPEAGRLRWLRRSVLGFAATGLRPLPWRFTRDPWAVLVSEVMLQQTQVTRVLGAWERFMERFPTPSDCAAASPAAVLEAWAGLGYNRRALALHRSARHVVEHHGGVLPSGVHELLCLPGVGPYTARAVACFAGEADVAPVDTNVARVLARALVGARPTPSRLQALADALVPRGRAWEWNQALIELGALCCTARSPRCGSCPLSGRCRWRRSGCPAPDPGAPPSRQSAFEGSDRQGRGRLVAALRGGPIRKTQVPAAAGWPDDAERAQRVARALVAEGLAAPGVRGGLAPAR